VLPGRRGSRAAQAVRGLADPVARAVPRPPGPAHPGVSCETAGVDDAGELERVYRRGTTPVPAAPAARPGARAPPEGAVQDACVEAVEHWRAAGVPPNPGGWLATTAWRKAVDRIRRDRAGQEKLALLAAAVPLSPGHPGEHDSWGSRDQADELLGLIFAC